MNAQPPVRIEGPAEAALTVAEVKEFLRLEVDETEEDQLLLGLIAAAIDHLDGYRGILAQALVNQTWSMKLDGFPNERLLRLPLGPLIELVSVSYFNAGGEAKSLGGLEIRTDALGPSVVLAAGQSWPVTATRPDAVTVTWKCGFGNAAADVPAAIRTAAKMLIGHWFANREAVNVGNIVTEMPFGAMVLLAPFRRTGS